MVNTINSGDTAWLLVCCSLVLLMTPALALFYGGMVRRKNVLSTLTLSYIFMALIGIQWILYGYSLSFGEDIQGLIGGLNFTGFRGVGALPNAAYSSTIPHSLFAAFQMMFAVITPALITGAFVERVKFISFLLFSGLGHPGLRPPLSLGLGTGRLAESNGRSGFCRRNGCPYCRRFFRPCLCLSHRTAQGIR